MALGSQTNHAPRGSMPWLEIVLPIYALTIVVFYYRPNNFYITIADEGIEQVVMWTVWVLGGALAALLALSGLVLAFYLLYSPLYLAKNLRRALGRGVWIDSKEVRFYLYGFGLLCVIIALVVWNLEIALVVFTMLAGSAKLLWRLLL